MTGYEVNRQLTKEFGIIVGPSIVYSKLYSLERGKLITCIRKKRGRAYKLTKQGLRIVDHVPHITEEIHCLLKALLIKK